LILRSVTWPKFLSVALLLVATAILLHAREKNEVLPAHQSLASFPYQIGNLEGKDIPLGDDVLEVLGPGQFLMREYSGSRSEQPINLYIAFFPSQRTGDTIHSPKNCLPGSGWTSLSASRIPVSRADGTQIFINRYVSAKGLDRDLVFYWYQAHNRVTPSEYWAKIYLVTDAIKLNRTDGALVRVVVPVTNSNEQAADQQGMDFIKELLNSLDPYIPR
jgi:EpsI family protein